MGCEKAAITCFQPSIRNINYPPSKDQLQEFEDVPLHELPKPYKRADGDRISLSSIKFYGFDMDYTLAVYKIYEMVYNHAVQRLVSQGYPPALLETKFEAEFGMRGLFFDRLHGNLLKVDSFGNIIRAMHGKRPLTETEIDEIYPSRYIAPSEMPNYFLLDTLFNVPETCLLATVVDMFEHDERSTPLPTRTGVKVAHYIVAFASMQADIRDSIDYVHRQGLFKKTVLEDIDTYVDRDARLPLLLLRMHQNGCKVFLVTNSDYAYTNAIMTYLFDVPLQPGMPTSWREYFDIIVVSANKPLFFEEGTMLREVDVLILGQFAGNAAHGRVLAGGSSHVLSELLGSRGNDVLYIGDSIFGDVLKSKKLRGWSTLLVIPELKDELAAYHAAAPALVHLKNLEFVLAETFRALDSCATTKPDVTEQLTKHIEETLNRIERYHNSIMGGLFRYKNRETFFAMQMRRYADLYSTTCTNLFHYPLFYEYRTHDISLPHEETGSHSAWSMHFSPPGRHRHESAEHRHERHSSREPPHAALEPSAVVAVAVTAADTAAEPVVNTPTAAGTPAADGLLDEAHSEHREHTHSESHSTHPHMTTPTLLGRLFHEKKH